MGIITNVSFEGIVDRIAKQAEHLAGGLTAAKQVGAGLGLHYTRVHSGVGLGDSDVEEDLVAAAADLDENFLNADSFALVMNGWISALDTHVRNQEANGLDAFLETSGINVHDYFAEVFEAVKGSKLSAINVFCPTELTLASICPSGSGVGVWTDGDVLGTGSGEVSDTNHAAANLVVELRNDDMCVSGMEIDLCLTKEDGTSEVKTVNIPAGTSMGDRLDVGTHPGDAYLDCTDVVFTGGCSGLCCYLISEIERTIAL